MRVADRRQSRSSHLAQSAHHVKYYACLTRLIEVQIVPNNDVKQVVRSQTAVKRRLHVIAGDKKLLLSVGSSKGRGLRIVGAVGKKLQSQKRMSSPTFSQIDLDGVRIPFSVRPHHDKVQSEPSDDSFFGETLAHLCRFPGYQRSIAAVGRERASKVTLP